LLGEIANATGFEDVGFVLGADVMEEDIIEEVAKNGGNGLNFLDGADVEVFKDAVRSGKLVRV